MSKNVILDFVQIYLEIHLTTDLKYVILSSKGTGQIKMKKLLRKFTVPLVTLFLISWVMSGATFANAGPRKPRKPPHAVAEPGTFALLGGGLVSIGLYAWKKRKRG